MGVNVVHRLVKLLSGIGRLYISERVGVVHAGNLKFVNIVMVRGLLSGMYSETHCRSNFRTNFIIPIYRTICDRSRSIRDMLSPLKLKFFLLRLNKSTKLPFNFENNTYVSNMAKIGISNAVYTVESALTRSNDSMSKNMTRIATGSATAVASDNATFKALSNTFALDIISTQSAIKSSGVMKGYLAAYISTVDSLSSFTSRAIELAVLGANDTNTDAEAAAIDQEALAIVNEMIRISNSEYKGKIFFEQNSHSEFLSMGGRGAEYEVTLGTALAEVLAIYDFDSLRLRVKPSDALNDTDGDGVVDTDAFTSKLEDLQEALNQMRVNAASDYAALEEAQILMTDLNVEYQKGFDIFSQINFSAETAALAKNQILQSAANAMLIQAKNAQAGLIKLID